MCSEATCGKVLDITCTQAKKIDEGLEMIQLRDLFNYILIWHPSTGACSTVITQLSKIGDSQDSGIQSAKLTTTPITPDHPFRLHSKFRESDKGATQGKHGRYKLC